ncbi:MAG: hypothetical protein Q9195_002600 [Heterodermia aff. obscurata]
MSAFSEQPFTEYEERYFLAEILKTSNIPAAHLLGFIEQLGIQPLWNEIALPNGRSLSACQRAFTRLRSRQGFLAPMRPPGAPEQQTLPLPKPRKRTPAGDLSTPSHATTPGFSSFPSVNSPSPAHGLPNVTTVGGKLQKKRGRPSKAEFDLKVAEAAARGEVYPPPKKIKTPKTPAEEGGAAAILGAPDDGGLPSNPTLFDVKKGTPKVKTAKVPQSALEATASAANALGQSSGAVGPDTQSTEIAPPESHSASRQEHPAQSETSPNEQQQQQQQQQPTQQGEPLPTAQNESFPTTQNEPYQTPYQQASSA